MNFWKQQTHIMAYFSDNFRGDKRLPSSFMDGFLEVSLQSSVGTSRQRTQGLTNLLIGPKLERTIARNINNVNISLCKRLFSVPKILPNALNSYNAPHIQVTILCM